MVRSAPQSSEPRFLVTPPSPELRMEPAFLPKKKVVWKPPTEESDIEMIFEGDYNDPDVIKDPIFAQSPQTKALISPTNLRENHSKPLVSPPMTRSRSREKNHALAHSKPLVSPPSRSRENLDVALSKPLSSRTQNVPLRSQSSSPVRHRAQASRPRSADGRTSHSRTQHNSMHAQRSRHSRGSRDSKSAYQPHDKNSRGRHHTQYRTMDKKDREQLVDDVAHHLQGLRMKDTCPKKLERHSFEFIKCGVKHYNKLYDEEDFFVEIPVKPNPKAKGYELFDDIMYEYLRRIAKRR